MAGQPVPLPTREDKKPMILCIEDSKQAAIKKLPEGVRDFINSGSTDQVTINENTAAYQKYRVRSRVLIDVSKTDTSVECFGKTISFPLCLASAGLQAMAHPDGELATSRACAKAGVHMGISTFANYSVKDIRDAGLSVGPIQHAMQMYTLKDRQLELRLIRDAEKNGCSAIFLTGDSPVLGVRYNEWRNDFRTPDGLGFPIVGWDSERIKRQSHEDSFMNFNDDSHNWAREIP